MVSLAEGRLIQWPTLPIQLTLAVNLLFRQCKHCTKRGLCSSTNDSWNSVADHNIGTLGIYQPRVYTPSAKPWLAPLSVNAWLRVGPYRPTKGSRFHGNMLICHVNLPWQMLFSTNQPSSAMINRCWAVISMHRLLFRDVSLLVLFLVLLEKNEKFCMWSREFKFTKIFFGYRVFQDFSRDFRIFSHLQLTSLIVDRGYSRGLSRCYANAGPSVGWVLAKCRLIATREWCRNTSLFISPTFGLFSLVQELSAHVTGTKCS